MSPRRFVMLDRDGTIIVERHHLSDPDGVELIPGAGDALRRLSDLGLGLVVISNQSAVGRGLLDLDGLAEIHRRMEGQLASHGVRLDGIYWCPHHPDDGCPCRKPRTGMVERASSELGFDPADGFLIGDMPADIDLGRAVGATTILVRTGHGTETLARGDAAPDHVTHDLEEAAALIRILMAGQ